MQKVEVERKNISCSGEVKDPDEGGNSKTREEQVDLGIMGGNQWHVVARWREQIQAEGLIQPPTYRTVLPRGWMTMALRIPQSIPFKGHVLLPPLLPPTPPPISF